MTDQTNALSNLIEQDAQNIAEIVNNTDSQVRGDLLKAVSKELEKLTQNYTANIFKTMARIYGTNGK